MILWAIISASVMSDIQGNTAKMVKVLSQINNV